MPHRCLVYSRSSQKLEGTRGSHWARDGCCPYRLSIFFVSRIVEKADLSCRRWDDTMGEALMWDNEKKMVRETQEMGMMNSECWNTWNVKSQEKNKTGRGRGKLKPVMHFARSNDQTHLPISIALARKVCSPLHEVLMGKERIGQASTTNKPHPAAVAPTPADPWSHRPTWHSHFPQICCRYRSYWYRNWHCRTGATGGSRRSCHFIHLSRTESLSG